MDDVEYLVEDNTMSDFCLSSEMDGTHGRTTFEDDSEQQLLRRAAHGIWPNGGASLGSKCKCWECSNHPNCLRFKSSWCQDIPDCMYGKESLQHKPTR